MSGYKTRSITRSKSLEELMGEITVFMDHLLHFGELYFKPDNYKYAHFKPQWKTYFPGSVFLFTVFSILTCECLRSPQNLLWNRASSSQSGTWTEHPGEGRSSWARGMLRTETKGRWLRRRTPLLVSCGLSVWHWWREENNKSYSCWQCTTNNKISVKNITCRT